ERVLNRPGASATSPSPARTLGQKSLALCLAGRFWLTTWFSSDRGRNPLRTSDGVVSPGSSSPFRCRCRCPLAASGTAARRRPCVEDENLPDEFCLVLVHDEL